MRHALLHRFVHSTGSLVDMFHVKLSTSGVPAPEACVGALGGGPHSTDDDAVRSWLAGSGWSRAVHAAVVCPCRVMRLLPGPSGRLGLPQLFSIHDEGTSDLPPSRSAPGAIRLSLRSKRCWNAAMTYSDEWPRTHTRP